MELRINIGIVDDHWVLVDGLASLLEGESNLYVKLKAQTAGDALDGLKKDTIDVMFIDISMPGTSGLELCKTIKDQFPSTKVLMLTMHDEGKWIEQAMLQGADGYLLKKSRKEELLQAIQNVLAGRSFYSPEVTQTLVDSISAQRNPAEKAKVEIPLTPREVDVLKLIVAELSTQQIASELGISVNTVDTHRKNLHSKLGVTTAVGLAKYAIKHGIISG